MMNETHRDTFEKSLPSKITKVSGMNNVEIIAELSGGEDGCKAKEKIDRMREKQFMKAMKTSAE